jgi:hypothetical protein
MSGRPLSLAGWAGSLDTHQLERERLIGRVRQTDATRQLQRCFPRWSNALDQLAWRALVRLAANEPVDPNDPDMWTSREQHAQAVLRRHGLTDASARRLSASAIAALIDGQATADRDVGLDWGTVTIPPTGSMSGCAAPTASWRSTWSDPAVYAHRGDQRHALARRLGLAGVQADDLSRWALAHPEQFDAGDLRCWRIGSDTWLALADERLEPVDRVERPVGLVVVPALYAEGW